jgi:polysaccharide export outer membrane protein
MKLHSYIVGLGLAALACAGPGPLPSEFTEDRLDQVEYRIEPADVVSVRVWRNPELSVEAPVLPDGTLTVPLVGQVRAKDLTAGEMEELITVELEEFVTAPDVSVVVMQVNSKRASVVGEVVRPGPVGLPADLRVMDALAAAGGFSPFANKRKVRVIRPVGDGEVEFIFNYEAFIAGKAPGRNVRVQPGDVIVVPD